MSLIMDTNEISERLDALPSKVDAALFALIEYWSPRVQSQARVDAPWTDRTGNARQGLRTTTEHGTVSGMSLGASGASATSSRMHAINLFHSMPYGIWLETRWSGAYAVILPTIENMGRQVMGNVRGLMGRMP